MTKELYESLEDVPCLCVSSVVSGVRTTDGVLFVRYKGSEGTVYAHTVTDATIDGLLEEANKLDGSINKYLRRNVTHIGGAVCPFVKIVL